MNPNRPIKFEELAIGARFGSLVVLEKVRKYSWNCICDCGKTKIFYHRALVDHGRSCGCRNVGGMVGQTIGHWTAIRELKNKYNQTAYECRCTCGKTTVKTENIFREKHTNSCGCMVERARKRRVPEDIAFFNKRFSNYKTGAKQRNLSFDLTREQFHDLMKLSCYYCASPPSRSISGVDRKDNALGYSTENAVSCCSVCNMKKNVTHHDDFLAWIKKIHDNLGLGA